VRATCAPRAYRDDVGFRSTVPTGNCEGLGLKGSALRVP